MPPLVPVSIVASKPEAPRTALSDADGTQAHAHAPDYTWLVGELQYLHVRKAWRVRYAPVDEEDRKRKKHARDSQQRPARSLPLEHSPHHAIEAQRLASGQIVGATRGRRRIPPSRSR